MRGSFHDRHASALAALDAFTENLADEVRAVKAKGHSVTDADLRTLDDMVRKVSGQINDVRYWMPRYAPTVTRIPERRSAAQ